MYPTAPAGYWPASGPGILLFSFWAIVAWRWKKRWFAIAGLAAALLIAALSASNVITQWRLALLTSEDPSTVDEAYTNLSHSISSAHACQIIKSKSEDANIRFALTVMLYERGEISLLNSVSIAPLEHPDFFGDDHLATLGHRFDYPITFRHFVEGHRFAKWSGDSP